MQRIELGKGYKLVADAGKDLVVLNNDVELARVKEVIIPTGQTLNNWVEVAEVILST